MRALPIAFVLGAFVVTRALVAGQSTQRVSVDSSGAEANGPTGGTPAFSADGRFIVFDSAATNLVASDGNGVSDIFVRDRATGITERVSVDSSGAEANGGCSNPSISADGRFVVFTSLASNLVAGDGNHFADVFVHDRSTGVTERVSVDSAGVEGKSISDGGRISADGRFVSFTSYSSNLVAGDTNGVDDVFVRDRSTGSTERVSVDSAGTEANGYSNGGTISADGQVVTFDSYASNLVPGDTNGWTDVFLHDRSSGVTERVSVDSFGTQGNFESFSGAPSADGRFVAFSSLATNLDPGGLGLDVFVRDRQTGVTERISKDASGGPANGFCLEPAISADGRFVIFTSDASDLVAGDTNLFYDVFVHDRSSGRTERVSVSTSGAQADQECAWPALSADGRFVAFRSLATNVVSGDTNGVHDDFVRGPYLTLEADPALVSAGSILTFTTWTGAANRLALLVATEINGTPTFVPAVFGSFDATGLWVFSATVPAGLSGIAAGFQTFGFVETGKADVSNAFTVDFQ